MVKCCFALYSLEVSLTVILLFHEVSTLYLHNKVDQVLQVEKYLNKGNALFSKQIKSWKMNPIMILLTLWNSVQWKPNMILHTVSLEEPRVFKNKTIFKATDCGKQK